MDLYYRLITNKENEGHILYCLLQDEVLFQMYLPAHYLICSWKRTKIYIVNVCWGIPSRGCDIYLGIPQVWYQSFSLFILFKAMNTKLWVNHGGSTIPLFTKSSTKIFNFTPLHFSKRSVLLGQLASSCCSASQECYTFLTCRIF